MRLRNRLLFLFAVFAVLPLLAMGGFDYARSLRHLEAVLSTQTAALSERAARELRDRLDALESDITLLSRNAESEALLRSAAGPDSAATRAARQAASLYWDELWRNIRQGYQQITLYDAAGNAQLRRVESPDPSSPRTRDLTQVRDIHDPASGALLGRLELTPRLADLFRSPVFRSAFGSGGRTLIVDRRDRQVLADPGNHPPVAEDTLFGFDRLDTPAGTFAYGKGSARRVASFVSFERPAWSLLVTGSVDEFAAPFIRLRFFDLALLLGVIVAVSAGFYLLLRRATAALERITDAADRVGRGDFDPPLPPAGPDEIGRLSTAFTAMTGRIREMIAQVEASRQMGVLGRFAAELAHEIRNPLTAIKINLQGLARDAEQGRIGESGRKAIDLALREIRRLDLAVKTALKTGRPPADPQLFGVLAVLHDAVELIRPQADAQSVRLECESTAAMEDGCLGDAESLRAALVNLLLNGLEAMPAGGHLRVFAATSHADPATLEIRIEDQGPGIPIELRDRIFRPFFTTKPEGTGLGLSLALETVRAHGGSLTLESPPRGGTTVVISLPLQPVAAPV